MHPIRGMSKRVGPDVAALRPIGESGETVGRLGQHRRRLQNANRTSEAYASLALGPHEGGERDADHAGQVGEPAANSAASGKPSGAASAMTKYEPAGVRHRRSPPPRSPSPSRSRLACEGRRGIREEASGSRSPMAMAGWNGAPLT